MRKVIASFSVMVYFAFACGIMVNYHYCMDRYTSIKLYQPATNLCPICGMHTKKQGCCHDEVKIVKLQSDYQTSSVSFSIKNIQPAIAMPPEFFAVTLMNGKTVSLKIEHSPPLITQQDTYLQNRAFRI
jgi:hypothetical protein